ncbi:MAG: hypothetical protein JW814_01340 [Candidatus Krumholzibacteriota bacterium]|nr:hypothetical protein [Candidatus Krumholzibacteriota bacterium]
MTIFHLPVELLLILMGSIALVEAASVLGLYLLHRSHGIYYLPRNAPRLSRKCRDFISRLAASEGTGDLMRLDAELGWSPVTRVAPGNKYSTNSIGARGCREYSSEPPDGKTRVTTFGDCLTFGDGSAFEDTWQAKLEALDGRFEVINLGVEGYGPGQAFLRYLRSGEQLRRQGAAILSIATSNIFKPLNIFRPFYSYDHGIMLSKPGFSISNSSLAIIPNPLDSLERYQELLNNPRAELNRIGALDRYFQQTYRGSIFDLFPHHRLLKIAQSELRRRRQTILRSGSLAPRSESLQTSLAIFDEFHYRAASAGTRPIFILFPLKKEIDRFIRKGARPYDPIISHFIKNDYEFIDMLDPFNAALKKDGNQGFYMGRHLSPNANGIIAEAVLAFLRADNQKARS